MKCKKGQILECTEDIEMKGALSNEKKIVKKGTKIIIGADGLLHYQNGMIQPIPEDFEIEDDFDSKGISKYIYYMLNKQISFLFDDMIDGYDISKNEFINEIEYALEEIGIY